MGTPPMSDYAAPCGPSSDGSESIDSAPRPGAAPPLPIRRRAFSRKVRSGCTTWIRHKKCDESRPICHRCLKGGYSCGGYSILPAPEPTETAPLVSSTSQRLDRLAAPTKATLLSPALYSFTADPFLYPVALGSDAEGRGFFWHFQTVVIADLIRLVDAGDFWVAHVLPLCHTEPAVLHAAAALGAAHRLYQSVQSSRRRPGGGVAHAMLEQAVIRHYNRAIRQVLVSLDVTPVPAASTTTADAPGRAATLVVCCLVFYCLESLQSRPREALGHLRAGTSLLLDCRTDLGPAPCSQLIGPSLAFDAETSLSSLLRQAASALDRLGIDATLLSDEDGDEPTTPILPFLTEPRVPAADDPCMPFSSLQEAKDAMWCLDTRLFRMVGPASPVSNTDMDQRSTIAPATCLSTCSRSTARETHALETNVTGNHPDNHQVSSSHDRWQPPRPAGDPAWTLLQRDFRRWSARFERAGFSSRFRQDDGFLPQQQLDVPTPALREYLMMTIRRRPWDMLTRPRRGGDDDDDGDDTTILRGIYEATLAAVGAVYAVERELSPLPVFTLDCDTIPLLAIIAGHEPALLPRVVRLLREYQRREGLWDSIAVAERLEAHGSGSAGDFVFSE
ncbi:transcriptional activator protein UGA3 [Microdochium nivale]|nr:transcriptional activator protein UGA3 [Microdochium nivale]